MAAIYSLWETASGNIINTYDTEAQALAVVRATIAEHGRDAVATLALARETNRGVKQLAEGESLAERARWPLRLPKRRPCPASPRPKAPLCLSSPRR